MVVMIGWCSGCVRAGFWWWCGVDVCPKCLFYMPTTPCYKNPFMLTFWASPHPRGASLRLWAQSIYACIATVSAERHFKTCLRCGPKSQRHRGSVQVCVDLMTIIGNRKQYSYSDDKWPIIDYAAVDRSPRWWWGARETCIADTDDYIGGCW